MKLSRNLLIYFPPLFAIAFMSIVMWANWPMWERSFFSDNSPVSWLSAAQIFSCAFLVLQLLIHQKINFYLGLWLLTSMVYMSLDEQFMYHEWWKFTCQRWFSLCRFSVVREAPILLVGIFGCVTLVVLYKNFQQTIVRRLFSISIFIGVIAVVVDQTNWLEAVGDLEEGFECMAEAFFMSGLLAISKPDIH